MRLTSIHQKPVPSTRRSNLALAALLVGGCGRVGFDAGGDAGPDSDARGRDGSTPGGFCAGLTPQPLFCDDFSDGVMAPWQLLSEDLGALVEANGVLTTTTQTLATATDITQASWRQDIGTQNEGVAVAFDIDTPVSSASNPVILELVFGEGGNDEHYFEWVHKLDGPAYIEEIVVRPPAANQFFDYMTPMALSPGPHRVSMVFDAARSTIVGVVDGITLINATTNDTMAGSYALHIGVPYLAGPSAPWELRFDNLEVELP